MRSHHDVIWLSHVALGTPRVPSPSLCTPFSSNGRLTTSCSCKPSCLLPSQLKSTYWATGLCPGKRRARHSPSPSPISLWTAPCSGDGSYSSHCLELTDTSLLCKKARTHCVGVSSFLFSQNLPCLLILLFFCFFLFNCDWWCGDVCNWGEGRGGERGKDKGRVGCRLT